MMVNCRVGSGTSELCSHKVRMTACFGSSLLYRITLRVKNMRRVNSSQDASARSCVTGKRLEARWIGNMVLFPHATRYSYFIKILSLSQFILQNCTCLSLSHHQSNITVTQRDVLLLSCSFTFISYPTRLWCSSGATDPPLYGPTSISI